MQKGGCVHIISYIYARCSITDLSTHSQNHTGLKNKQCTLYALTYSLIPFTLNRLIFTCGAPSCFMCSSLGSAWWN